MPLRAEIFVMEENLADSNIHVLVVEDEKEIRELMALHLLRHSFKVKECASAEEAMNVLSLQQFDLCILDWMLPGLSGVDLINIIKHKMPQTTVLMVTAKTEPLDIVNGLEKGADDYLTKPFDPSVFMARVKALLRRRLQEEGSQPQDSEIVKVAGLLMNFKTYEVSLNSLPLHLTPSEFKLLGAMVQDRGRVLTREKLIEKIQGEGINVVGRTIDTHVFGLRKKLNEWGDNIETIRGVGYRVKAD